MSKPDEFMFRAQDYRRSEIELVTVVKARGTTVHFKMRDGSKGLKFIDPTPAEIQYLEYLFADE